MRTLALGFMVVVALGCSVELQGAEPPRTSGAFSLALTQTGGAGETYRLTQAMLTIAGPVERTLMSNSTDATLEAELPEGDYTLMLEPGYSLVREQAGVSTPVEAMLVSENPLPFSIAAGARTAVSLRFALADGEVIPVLGTLEIGLVVQEPGSMSVCENALVINEVDYDQEGSDSAELVEIYNPSDCASSLSGVSLVLYNGGSGAPAPYATLALDAAGAELPAHGYLVVGTESVLAALPAGTPGLVLSAAIQNGDPDGLAIERDGLIEDSLSYGGSLTGITETASAPKDSPTGTLGRCGADSDDNSVDFKVLELVTAGAANAC